MILKVDGELWRVHDYQHVTPGNYNAVMQARLRNLRSGNISNYRFKCYDKVEKASLDTRNMEYLYKDGDHFVFMDSESYEQIHLSEEDVGEAAQFLKENQAVVIESFEGTPLGLNLPKTVDLKVVHTEPGLKGATVTNVGKPVTLETGLIITAPQFVDIGDIIRVDTEECAYVERLKA